MGKAVEDRQSQFRYVKNRIQLLRNTVNAMDEDQVSVEDLDRLLALLNSLELKMNRFRKDWVKEEQTGDLLDRLLSFILSITHNNLSHKAGNKLLKHLFLMQKVHHPPQ